MDFEALLGQAFELPEKDWSQYSPLTLAWLGDTVFDLIVRTVLLKRADRPADRLHRMASGLVNARAQADFMESIRGKLTDREMSIYRRGRNASPGHTAKNADRTQYLEATGFECLIGYLYLERQYGRILELVKDLPETELNRQI